MLEIWRKNLQQFQRYRIFPRGLLFLARLVRSCKLKCSLHHARQTFISSFFTLYIWKSGKDSLRRSGPSLVHGKCLPILLYGLEVCPLTKTDYGSLDFVVMRFLMKLFCTSNTHIVNECRIYIGFKLPSEIIPMRIDKFMSKLSTGNVHVLET